MSGYDVHVLEARGDRVGGRVWTRTDIAPQRLVEGGAELIGSNHPTWMAYAQVFGLDFYPVTDEPHSPIVVNGKTLTNRESKRLLDGMEAILEQLTNHAARVVDPFEPWLNADADELDAQSLKKWLNNAKGQRDAKLAVERMLVTDNGAPADQQSLLGNLAMIKGGGLDRFWTHTEVFRCKSGNDSLARALAKPLIDDGRLRKPACVNRISWVKTGGLRVHVQGDQEPIEAADVILTAPPRTWRDITFDRDPPVVLPTVSTGKNVKYFMHVTSRFWRERSGADLSQDGKVDLTWESTQHQGHRDAVLTAFSGGPDAEACEAFDDKPRDYIRDLRRAYPRLVDRMLNSEFIDWPNEMWSLASYSFPRPGEVITAGPILEAGIDRLHFAGEHTCYAFVGYMEGALASGVRVARRIMRRDGLVP